METTQDAYNSNHVLKINRICLCTLNKNYVIESSYEPTTVNWNVVHSFIERESKLQWADPLTRDVTAAFYRIREGR